MRLALDVSFRPLDGESISKPNMRAADQAQRSGGFRPLDGESISKLPLVVAESVLGSPLGFRPLDGESISKPRFDPEFSTHNICFRPLDGESISKRKGMRQRARDEGALFPSPRRGINF